MPETNQEPLSQEPRLYPMLPLRDIVIFPYMVAPLFVGRKQSIGALEKASEDDKLIFLTSQKDPKIDNPKSDDLYGLGTIGKVVQLLKLPDGTVKVLVEGVQRGQMTDFVDSDDLLEADVTPLEDQLSTTSEVEAVMRAVNTSFDAYVGLSKKVPVEVSSTISGIEDPSRLADTIAGHMQVPITDKQEILEIVDPVQRLEHLLVLLEQEIEILQVEGRIRSRVKSQMERSQKEYYLNEQMRAIQKELGEQDEFKQEILEFEEQNKEKKDV